MGVKKHPILSFKKSLKKIKKVLAFILTCGIIVLHLKIAAVVQRLVHMLAMHMMTVRFRSVAPALKTTLIRFKVFIFLYFKTFIKLNFIIIKIKIL